MKLFHYRTGIILVPIVLAARLAVEAPVHAGPLPLAQSESPAQAAQRQPSSASQEALLKKLTRRISGALRQETLLTKPFHDEDGESATEYHARLEKLRVTDRSGRETGRLVGMVVPAADGLHLSLQLVDGKYVTAAVRPQELPRQYRNQAGTSLKWNVHLDSYWLEPSNVTLLINLDYGKKIKPEVISRILALVAQSVTEISGGVKNPQFP